MQWSLRRRSLSILHKAGATVDLLQNRSHNFTKKVTQGGKTQNLPHRSGSTMCFRCGEAYTAKHCSLSSDVKYEYCGKHLEKMCFKKKNSHNVHYQELKAADEVFTLDTQHAPYKTQHSNASPVHESRIHMRDSKYTVLCWLIM